MEPQGHTEIKKEELSYRYWVKPNNPDVKIDTAPQKLNIAKVDSTTEQKPLGPSPWNTSGTWQQRKISMKDLQQRLGIAFLKLKTSDAKAVIESVKVSGEASAVYSRGKKGLTYELKIILGYKGTEGYEDASGDFNFEEFTDHGDRQCTVSPKGQKNKDEVKKSVIADKKKYIQMIEAELNKYKE